MRLRVKIQERFYSILVRLEVLLGKCRGLLQKFLFHTGSIRGRWFRHYSPLKNWFLFHTGSIRGALHS